ncbi:MAG TPA: redoxin domain-containing protein [Burkholderiales bacterium]|nr:redoxin domain-containing protein [Burkholderiales bacterium]
MKTYLRALQLGLLMILAGLVTLSQAERWNYRIGEVAPAFNLTSLDGKPVSLADYKGKIVVMSFMTSWCTFCNAAAPYFEQIRRQYQDKGVQTLIVDVHEEKGPIAEFVKKHNLTCPVALDLDGKITERYAPPPTIAPDLKREETMIASFMIVDRQGKIRFLSLNEDTAKFDAKLTKLRKRLDALLAEK